MLLALLFVLTCGDPVSGIALCVSPSAIEVRNVGTKDAVLNLGVMLANGARQYPRVITLLITDEKGVVHHVHLLEPSVVAGRLDPLVAPLPSGASLGLPLDISKYWSTDFTPDPKKRYTIQAQFTGKGVNQAQANGDVKGISLMPYWTGTIRSNSVVFEPR